MLEKKMLFEVNKKLIRKIAIVLFFFVIFLVFLLLIGLLIENQDSRDLEEWKSNNYYFPQHHDLESGVVSKIHEILVDKYKCIGSCYCNKNNLRRSPHLAAKHGLVFIVSGITAFVAIKNAQKRFNEECWKEFSDNDEENMEKCGKSEITAEVEECENVVVGTGSLGENGERFWCYGKCFGREIVPISSELLGAGYTPEQLSELEEKMMKERDQNICQKIEYEGEIVILKGDDPKILFQNNILGPTCHELGKETIKTHLKLSLKEKKDQNSLEIILENLDSRPDSDWAPCTSNYYNNELNPSINCKEMIL